MGPAMAHALPALEIPGPAQTTEGEADARGVTSLPRRRAARRGRHERISRPPGVTIQAGVRRLLPAHRRSPESHHVETCDGLRGDRCVERRETADADVR